MEQSFRFFSNRECKYYPCHKGVPEADYNCLFCYCPMYSRKECLGYPKFIISKRGKRIKDCSGCNYPHKAENYENIIQFLAENPVIFEEE